MHGHRIVGVGRIIKQLIDVTRYRLLNLFGGAGTSTVFQARRENRTADDEFYVRIDDRTAKSWIEAFQCEWPELKCDPTRPPLTRAGLERDTQFTIRPQPVLSITLREPRLAGSVRRVCEDAQVRFSCAGESISILLPKGNCSDLWFEILKAIAAE